MTVYSRTEIKTQPDAVISYRILFWQRYRSVWLGRHATDDESPSDIANILPNSGRVVANPLNLATVNGNRNNYDVSTALCR